MNRHVQFKFHWVLLLIFLSTDATSALTSTTIENFKYQCSPNTEYDLYVSFAPVKKLAEQLKPARQWSYEYLTEDRQFLNRQIKLPEKGAARVDVVLQLNRSESAKTESYLWQVIIAPKVKDWSYGGHWATKLPVTAYQRLQHKRSSLIVMATLSALNGQPVHSKISPQDVDKAGTLNKGWVDVFGAKIIDLVYAGSDPAALGKTGYSATFYYVPTPTLSIINRNGYKWPSVKHVDRPGTVFSFVLTPEGECLNWNSIDVVTQ
ncbi:MAG: hypothetical protein ACI9KN_002142 [Gammaproteobacteria bacterium]|jgi:hypothetical protein